MASCYPSWSAYCADPTLWPLLVVTVVLDISCRTFHGSLLLVLLIRQVDVREVSVILERAIGWMGLLVAAHSESTSILVALEHVTSSVTLACPESCV